MEGYIKRWRSTLGSDILQNPLAYTLFDYLLLRANWKERNGLQAGQGSYGRKQLADFLGTTEQKIRTALEFLILTNRITIKSTNRFTIYTIVNWAKYQGEEINQPIEQPAKQPTNNQQITTLEERKKERKEPNAQFEIFWKAYPRRVGKGKAEQSWNKENPDLEQCLKALEWQKKCDQWTKDNGQFIPHPATWLNQKRWMDEKTTITPKAQEVAL